jgi:hypothetical protein
MCMPRIGIKGRIQNLIWISALLFLGWFGMPGRAMAWYTLTHPYLARIAFDQMPDDFEATFKGHFDAIFAGAIAPDLVLMDWSNHEWNVHSGEGGQGGAPARVQSLFDTILEGLKEKEPDYQSLAYDLGLLAHYLADINQPLHTDDAYLEELVHMAYELDVYSRQDTFAFLDHGRRFFLDPYAESIVMAESANRYYDQIMENYLGGTRYEGLERRTALQLQNAVDAITDGWTTLWLRATVSVPSLGIRTNQAFYWSGDSVELSLSTLSGNGPTPSADIYVAVADRGGDLWFIGPEGISGWPPAPWRSGVNLSDETSVVLSFQLGEIAEGGCYGLYAVAVPTGQDPLDPQWWLSRLAEARFCLALP